MNLTEIGIDPDEARAKLAEYSGLEGGGTTEDQAILAGYRAVATGKPLISLARTVTAGGWFGNGLPRIAVTGAEAHRVSAHWDSGAVVFHDEYSHGNRGALVGRHSLRVPIPGDDRPGILNRWSNASTVVPLVPPGKRPRRPAWLGRRHILWEVEKWDPTPPRDPALIKHVRGDLWIVEDTWDLTELERYVLSQRA